MKVDDLNQAIADNTIGEIISITESRQRKYISHIADAICYRRAKVVLIAGASSAGKTTTAKRLVTQLRVNDKKAALLSTDDYFVGDVGNPRDENGNFDYEHIKCVNAERLTQDLMALLAGKTIKRRRFDFAKHAGYDSDEIISLGDNGAVVLEGLHALNPIITEGIDNFYKYGIIVQPRPSLELKTGLRPTEADSRLLRRIVRDHCFRKVAPAETFRMWPNVMAGEEKWIKPCYALADIKFDSYLAYELAAIKPLVMNQLLIATKELGETQEIKRLYELLWDVFTIGDEKIPGDSILRETIGGSQLDY